MKRIMKCCGDIKKCPKKTLSACYKKYISVVICSEKKGMTLNYTKGRKKWNLSVRLLKKII